MAPIGKSLLAALGLVFVAGAMGLSNERTGDTVVILVRHAEKAAAPADDPRLNEAGMRRAEALAHALASTGVKAILTTQYQRTRQTAEPTAKLLNLPITQLNAANSGAFGTKIRAEHRGQTVLVVGHSNTIPEIIAGLGATVPAIPDTDYDNFYVVHLPAEGPAHVISLQYGQPN